MIVVENLTRTYYMGSVEVPALKNVSFQVNSGEMVAIMGPSGSGKSTLMNMLGCLDTPTSGRYVLEGAEVHRLRDGALARIRNQRIGFVFQSYNLLSRNSALANVELPLVYTGQVRGRRQKAMAAIRQVGLEGRARHRPSQLSGGEQQRVAIARALVNEPALILADEPTGNLDSRSSNEIMSLLQGLNRQQGITILIVTHEQEIAEHANRILRFKDGQLESDERIDPPRIASAQDWNDDG